MGTVINLYQDIGFLDDLYFRRFMAISRADFFEGKIRLEIQLWSQPEPNQVLAENQRSGIAPNRWPVIPPPIWYRRLQITATDRDTGTCYKTPVRAARQSRSTQLVLISGPTTPALDPNQLPLRLLFTLSAPSRHRLQFEKISWAIGRGKR